MTYSEYYECSRYKENPNIANESAHAKAREALKKYLFYFERWENHAKVWTRLSARREVKISKDFHPGIDIITSQSDLFVIYLLAGQAIAIICLDSISVPLFF